MNYIGVLPVSKSYKNVTLTPSPLQLPPHRLVQRLRKVPDVSAVQPRHRDAPVRSQVDVCLLRQRLGLLRIHPGKAVPNSTQDQPPSPSFDDPPPSGDKQTTVSACTRFPTHSPSLHPRARAAPLCRSESIRTLVRPPAGTQTAGQKKLFKKHATTHLNIPIWFTMCSHLPGVFSSSASSRYSSLRISMILPAIVRMSRFHSSNSSALFRMSDTCRVAELSEPDVNHSTKSRSRLTTRAPYEGGLLISLRCSTDNWLRTRSAVSFVGEIMCSAPTRSPYSPAFFAKLCHVTAQK